MKYTISEFARILGVTSDTLRVYEKQGIITPGKGENNYRYYTDLDCRNVLMSRWYRSLNLPLKKVSVLTTGSTIQEIQESIFEKQNNLRREIELSRKLLVRLEEVSFEIENLESSLEACELVKRQGIYRIRQTLGNELINDEPLKKTAEQWMKLLPHSFFTLQIQLSELNGNKDELIYNWGLGIREEDFRYFGLTRESWVQYVPPSQGVRTVLKINTDKNLRFSKFVCLLDYLTRYKLSPAGGDLQGKIILTEKDPLGQYHTFIEILLPVQ